MYVGVQYIVGGVYVIIYLLTYNYLTRLSIYCGAHSLSSGGFFSSLVFILSEQHFVFL